MDPKYYKYMSDAVKYYNKPPIFTLDQIDKTLPYVGNFKCKPGIHIGQRKLFLSEMQFLNNVLTDLNTPTYVVYAGAAPSNKMWLLSTFYPNVVWILVDPNKFEIMIHGRPHTEAPIGGIKYLKSAYVRRANGEFVGEPMSTWIDIIGAKVARIYIVEDLMTDEYATLFAKLAALDQSYKLYFVSDIRTDEVEDTPTDLDIIWNLAQQYVWIQLMRPAGIMLKFRTTYGGGSAIPPERLGKHHLVTFAAAKNLGIDFLKNYADDILEYFDGQVNIQVWAGKSSSESRLVSLDIDSRRKYNRRDYEDRFFYYNCILRGFAHHENKWANPDIGFDHCSDCAMEASIWADYSRFRQIDIHACVNNLNLSTGRKLLMRGHGNLFEPSREFILARTKCGEIDQRKFIFAELGKGSAQSAQVVAKLAGINQIMSATTIRMSMISRRNYMEKFRRDIQLENVRVPLEVGQIRDSLPYERGQILLKWASGDANRMGTLTLVRILSQIKPEVKYLIVTSVGYFAKAPKIAMEWFPGLTVLQFGAEGVKFRESIIAPGKFNMYNDNFDDLVGDSDIMAKLEQIFSASLLLHVPVLKIAPADFYQRTAAMLERARPKWYLCNIWMRGKDTMAAELSTVDFAPAQDVGEDQAGQFGHFGHFDYIGGTPLVLPWSWHASLHTVILGEGDKLELVHYDGSLGDRLHYYNTIERQFVHHYNPLAGKIAHFDHCADCAMEFAIWQMYARFRGVDKGHFFSSVRDWVGKLGRLCESKFRPKFAHKPHLLRKLDDNIITDIYMSELQERKNLRIVSADSSAN